MTRLSLLAKNGAICPDHRIERDARDGSALQVCFEAGYAAVKGLIVDQEERGEGPIPIRCEVVEIVVVRNLNESRLNETSTRHLRQQVRDRRIALQLDTDRFGGVTGERAATR